MASQREPAVEVFQAALSLQSSRREAFLDEACSHDPALRRAVEELLAEDARAGSFLQHPVVHLLDKTMAGPSLETAAFAQGDGNVYRSGYLRALQPGQTLIDRFVIVRFIAKGGMGEVYEAEDGFLQGVHVALKTILPRFADEPALKQRFEREVLLARKVIHPNLCPIYEIFHCEEPPAPFFFLTMKLLPGKTLAERLRQPGAISVKEGMEILRQMAAGLAAIHDQDIVHRDIKPNNIMLEGSGEQVRLWITDFGLARAHESETSLQSRYGVTGTPGYIAPELYSGHSPSQASDLYAFGVVLHEVFTGKKPTEPPDGSSVIVSPLLNSTVPLFCSNLVRECLDPDPERRCQAFEQALVSLGLKRPTTAMWTRRRFIGAAAVGICAVGASTWAERETIYDLLHPLPGKRFVALLNWPRTSDNQIAPLLTGVLAAIKGQLSRIEALDHDLFVISPDDVDPDIAQAANFREVCDPLGANLVLAASGVPGRKHFELLLRVLDPITGHALRSRNVECDLNDATALPARAVKAAASLLDVGPYLKDSKRTQPGTNSTAAFTAFQQAEALMKQPNDAGLDAAIEKYKEAVDLDPQYALAHAKLGMAYGHLYGIRRDSAALDLARNNCEHALALDPDLVDGHLARAWVLEQTGNEQDALGEFREALALDPADPQALVWQAQLYGRLNRWTDAEATFRRVLAERPNYWLGYNELGFVLHGEAKYQKAIQCFRDATVAAPGNSLAWSNLGVEYLQIGDFADATECLKKSRTLSPEFDQAAANTSLALRYQGKYEDALPFALAATKLNPNDDSNWLELGECYTSLHNPIAAKRAYLRAAREAERHLATDKTNGPGLMLLALYYVKSSNSRDGLSLMKKADSLGARDMDSQLYKARILELLGKRGEALATLTACFARGATGFQIAAFPDLELLRKDPRYMKMALVKPVTNDSS
ncbi:MAG TPA: protein kinase [Acidobacteriaceae bacterium]|jgi:tetratricopeptide (TPR) repeat protein|nr:protein kinase [Acidobacteriaceae bacterium]